MDCRKCGRSKLDVPFDEGFLICQKCRDDEDDDRAEQAGRRERLVEEDRAQVEGREFEGPTVMDGARGHRGNICPFCQTEMKVELLRMGQRVGYVCTKCGHEQMDHHE